MGAHTVPPGAEIHTQRPQVQFSTANVPPPTGLLIQLQDQLQINIWSSVAVTVRVQTRLLLPDGTIIPNEWDITPTSARATNNRIFNLAEGFLLSAVAWVNSSGLTRGQCYVQLSLLRGGATQNFVGQVLCQGYITTSAWLCYPLGLNGFGLEGRGNFRTIIGSTPGAGTNWSFTVPTNATWRVVGAQATLATSATVATRTVSLIINDATPTGIYTWTALTSQPANTPNGYTVGNIPLQSGAAVAVQVLEIPPDLYISPAGSVLVVTNNIQAGDQWTSNVLYVEEWLTP